MSKTNGPQTGGSPGLRGYHYQRDLSVWAALDLMVAKRRCAQLVLEPASMEDLEADLGPEEPPRCALVAGASNERLVIQAKQSSRTSWSVKALATLLRHGTVRTSAADRLAKEPQTRYLLITDAPVTTALRSLGVSDFVGRPEFGSSSQELQRQFAQIHDRLAIMANVDTVRIEREVKDLLLEACLVPHRRWKECFDELRSVAAGKMTSPVTVPWMREELEAVVRSHGGLLTTSSEAQVYVRPTNWSLMMERLLDKHVVLLQGASGTGKTLTAEALWVELRHKVPGLERQVVLHASDLHVRQDEGPILFDIEDPWGKYRFDVAVNGWARSLAEELVRVHPNRYYVITSRSDILLDAKVGQKLAVWQIPLEPEHYGAAQRRELYRRRADCLPFELASLATNHRDIALEQLDTPLEIRKFFAALETGVGSDTSGARRIQAAIRFAHEQTISENVSAQIQERQAEHWAIVLWALFKGARAYSRAVVPNIQRRLADADACFEQGLEPLLNFFVAASNLRQKGDVISYAHPRVEEALENIVMAEPIRSERAISRVVDSVLSSPSAFGGEAGSLAAAASLLDAVRRLQTLQPSISATAIERVDRWLEQQVLEGEDRKFSQLMELAARIGSHACDVAEMARFLDTRPIKIWSHLGELNHIAERPSPDPDAAWFERMQASQSARLLTQRFIRLSLPHGHSYYADSLITQLQCAVGSLAQECLDAVAGVVHEGYLSNLDLLTEGALQDLDAFAPVVTKALKHCASDTSATWTAHMLAIENGEYNDDAEEHYSQLAGEEGHAAFAVLEKYAERLRAKRGWTALRDHVHANELAYFWCRAVNRENKAISESELMALVQACRGNDGEDECYRLHIHRQWRYPDVAYLLTRWERDDEQASALAAACLVLSAPHLLDEMAHEPIDSERLMRLVSLIAAASRGAQEADPDAGPALRQSLAQQMERWPPLPRELCCPLVLAPEIADWSLSDLGSRWARWLSPKTDSDRLTVVQFGVRNGFDVTDHIRLLLEQTQTSTLAVQAAELTNDTALLQVALRSQFNRVQAIAVRKLALEPQQLEQLAHSEGRYVRQEVMARIEREPTSAFVPALKVLLRDSWARHSHPDDENCPIARRAASALEKLDRLDGEDDARDLVQIALSVTDSVVRWQTLKSAARLGDEAVHGQLLSNALSPGGTVVREECATALLLSHQRVSQDMLNEVPDDHLLRIAPIVAVRLLTLVAAICGESRTLQLACTVASKPELAGYLLPLAFGAREVDAAIASKVLQLLPPRLRGLSEQVDSFELELSAQQLAGLGTTSVVQAVLNLFDHRKEGSEQ